MCTSKSLMTLRLQRVLQTTTGRLEYKHTTGKISVVRLEMAGMGTRQIRIANLPPETSERAIRMAFLHCSG